AAAAQLTARPAGHRVAASVTSLQPTRDDPSAMKGWLRRKTASPVPKPTRPPRGPRPPRPAPPKPRRRLKASVTARDNTPGSASSANRSTLIADIPFPAPENVAAKRCASEKRAFLERAGCLDLLPRGK